ncbi:MAG TPA: MFS transporter [Methanocorpusculum sp.]|nr:MFS transporter [Methanocorpusculum sp.]
MIIESRARQILLMILAASAVFMDYLDTSIVSIALPQIASDLSVTSQISSWVLICYLLALGSSLLIFGKLADRTGRYKLIFTLGFILFTLSSLFCGLAGNILLLILFRTLQGFAAALMVSTATSLITLHLPDKIQGFATGVIATGGGAALAAGPAVGGLLTGFFSWHWIFYINIPIGIAGVILALILIPKDTGREKPDTPFDLAGAGLLAVSLVSLLAGLEFGCQEGWPLYSIVLICIAPVFAVLFLRRELKHKDPVLSARLLLNRTVMFASVSTLLVTFVYIGLIYILPFYFTLDGFSITETGFIMLIPPLCLAVIGIPSGALTRIFGCRKLCSFASLILTAGIALLAAGMFCANFALIIAGLAVTGIGNGLNEGPSIRRITVHSPEDLQGSAGGLIFTVMNVGCVLGDAAYCVSATIASGSGEFTHWGIAVSCAVAVVFAFLAFVTSQAARDTVLN